MHFCFKAERCGPVSTAMRVPDSLSLQLLLSWPSSRSMGHVHACDFHASRQCWSKEERKLGRVRFSAPPGPPLCPALRRWSWALTLRQRCQPLPAVAALGFVGCWRHTAGHGGGAFSVSAVSGFLSALRLSAERSRSGVTHCPVTFPGVPAEASGGPAPSWPLPVHQLQLPGPPVNFPTSWGGWSHLPSKVCQHF